MPKRRTFADESAELFPVSRPAWETRGIFSEHFLRTRLDDVKSWPRDAKSLRPIYDHLLDLWHRRHVGFEKANEETTCREFLEPVLSGLGFSCLFQLDIPVSSSRLTPDYLLYSNEQTKDEVFNADLSTKYQAAIGLLEAKKVGHPLDAVSKSEVRFPHQQIREYLEAATNPVGRPYFRWGILTNGNYWRLYCRDAHLGAYFEFHLAGPKTNFCSFEEFKTFVALFSAPVFVEADGVCLLDEIRTEAIQYQADLEESIRRRVMAVVKDLANGFWSFKENGLDQQHLPEVYDNCLILLYRLLFVLYAEGLGLLPVKPSGAGSNVHYRERYSLSRLVHKLQSSTEFQTDDLPDLYDDLCKLFHLINGDHPSANKACAVPLYNGGLFDRKAHPRLEEWRIGDKSLANVLRDLIFSAGPSQRAKQKEFEWGTIDYADLEVRQLGDIYEGLLGGHLEVSGDVTPPDKLEVMGERAALQESGTFYTPDWVVRFLVGKTLRPLIQRIDNLETVQKSRKAGNKDNSFAREVLRLNILDPAMGSGHFLVRTTEWLADEIVYHPTTEFQVKEVPRGLSQEQAEISYWRRRVVEACIYGVDMNPLAVELAKLSLWLTCIASEEPLNFLDHHLRPGNSLIGAKLSELAFLPAKEETAEKEEAQMAFSLGTDFPRTVAAAIEEIGAIESESSDKLEVVKDKERRWSERVVAKLQPFKQIADIWTAASAGAPLTHIDYCQLGQLVLANHGASPKARQELTTALKRFDPQLPSLVKGIKPFHWELEYPDVFYDETGSRRANPGFDAILGNPPYISTQNYSEFDFRKALQPRFGYADDLYMHFVDQGFDLLGQGGRFGFIVSDTFFTLATKLRTRKILQANKLEYLVECKPFRATVDAAMFVAQKTSTDPKLSDTVTFIQARRPTKESKPDVEVPKLLDAEPKVQRGEACFQANGDTVSVTHAQKGCLRIHNTSVELYRGALKRAFFEPTEAIICLYNRFNTPTKRLVEEWWDRIETSRKFIENRTKVFAYQRTLKLGAITILGLLAEAGQGMSTGNNGRFLGYLEGTPQAKAILEKRQRLSLQWQEHPRVGPVFRSLLEEHGGDFDSVIEPLKERFDSQHDLGLQEGEVYRVVAADRVATSDDFTKALEFRKAELQMLWRDSKEVREYYDKLDKQFKGDFFEILGGLLDEASRKSFGPTRIGLKSGETYSEPTDASRTAAVYFGLVGRRAWVPYRKGDPEGNRWASRDATLIDWSKDNVRWLWRNSGSDEPNMPVIRNAHLYLTPGVTWGRHGNHVSLKARLQPACIFDSNSSRLTPTSPILTANQLLAILNSNFFSFFLKKFIKNSLKYEVNDLRMAPIVVPNRVQGKELETFTTWAIKAKELSLSSSEPAVELVAFCKGLAEKQDSAPPYLLPNAQMLLLHTADDCLAIIELAINWAVERLYGVQGLGPFNEF